MIAKRVILFCAAGASVALCLVLIHTFNSIMFGSIPHADASGERLSIATFRPNEEIVLSSQHGDRGIRIREYRFYWAAEVRHVDVRGNLDSMDYEHTSEPLVTGWQIEGREAEALDRMVQWFRGRDEERPIGSAIYEFKYYRDNRSIGQERFIGFQLPLELAYFEREAANGRGQPESGYRELALRNGLTRDELDGLLPFECLEIRHPDVN